MKNKVTAKMLRKVVKELRKIELKPGEDGLVEIEDPTVGTDFLYLKKIKKKGDNIK